MKIRLLIAFLLMTVALQAQITLKVNRSYIQDGALVLEFILTNNTSMEKTMLMDSRKTLHQTTSSGLDALMQQSIPQNAILFWDKKGVIEEVTEQCDDQLPQISPRTLKVGEKFLFTLETRCLSERVLLRLNNGKSVQYKMYIQYMENGAMQRLETSLLKLNVTKPTFH